jgi:hypothetical protein
MKIGKYTTNEGSEFKIVPDLLNAFFKNLKYSIMIRETLDHKFRYSVHVTDLKTGEYVHAVGNVKAKTALSVWKKYNIRFPY